VSDALAHAFAPQMLTPKRRKMIRIALALEEVFIVIRFVLSY
jgi:hypothetical protein